MMLMATLIIPEYFKFTHFSPGGVLSGFISFLFLIFLFRCCFPFFFSFFPFPFSILFRVERLFLIIHFRHCSLLSF